MYIYIVKNLQSILSGFATGVGFCIFMGHWNHPRALPICHVLKEPTEHDFVRIINP